MVLDSIPIWAFSILVISVVLLSIEVGFRTGRRIKATMNPDSEPPIAPISGSVLGLLGFVLAFTFGIVYNRYEARKDLVGQEANAIIRVWTRADFMSEPYRRQTVKLLKEYIRLRIVSVSANNMIQAKSAIARAEQIHRQLWAFAVDGAKKDGISGLAGPYILGLNDLIDIHGRRVAIGAEDRVPFLIWFSLFILLLLGMSMIGLLTAMKNSQRSSLTNVLALAFCMVFLVISALDRPFSRLFKVSQQPLIYAKTIMSK